MNEDGVWSKLVDEAYQRWQEGGDLHKLSYDQFLDHLDFVSRQAVLIGNLKGQVNNGGYQQFICNGYALHARQTRDILNEIGAEACLKVAKMLDEIIPYIDFNTNDKGCFGSYFKKNVNEDKLCDEGGLLDCLDDQFYGIGDIFKKEVEEYFQGLVKGNGSRCYWSSNSKST